MTVEVTEQDTALGLSDAEFLEQDPAKFLSDDSSTDTEDAANPEIDPADETADDIDPEAEAEGNSKAQEQTDATSNEEEVSQPDGDTQTEHEPSDDSDATESLDTSNKDSTDTKGDTQDTKEFDYESAYKKVSEPFKANGVDMQVKDPNDMIKLMQMGANYQKKMAQMKPNLKMIKMLENNGLLDEAKLSNLIDISKKDPKAVAKLIKESGIDPLDIDTDSNVDYKPTDYSVTDKEYNLDRVLDEIKDTETFSKTIDVLTKQWDDPSKTAISDNPDIIGIINTHMSNGVFDKVNTLMQQEKTLGNLKGVSDVEAYKQVAEYMYDQGLLRTETGSSPQGTSKVSSETDKSQANAERDKKRKAVAPVKQTTTKKAPAEKDFLGLSDEEFMKRHA